MRMALLVWTWRRLSSACCKAFHLSSRFRSEVRKEVRFVASLCCCALARSDSIVPPAASRHAKNPSRSSSCFFLSSTHLSFTTRSRALLYSARSSGVGSRNGTPLAPVGDGVVVSTPLSLSPDIATFFAPSPTSFATFPLSFSAASFDAVFGVGAPASPPLFAASPLSPSMAFSAPVVSTVSRAAFPFLSLSGRPFARSRIPFSSSWRAACRSADSTSDRGCAASVRETSVLRCTAAPFKRVQDANWFSKPFVNAAASASLR
mmetsp:Transcript_24697/g.62068  ORF Transcript_24697/g.62068 Transcript_24697/m.62068 type:complete len:262 (-) Transcript_24697:1049-1834(-)